MNGARQVGKTWLLREFAKQEYKKEAYVVCRKKNPDLHAIRYSMLQYREQEQLTNIPLYAV